MTYPPQGPGPYGQQPDPYQQQPPWAAGPQGGFPMAPPPKKPKTGLITSMIIVAILVLGGGGVGAYFLLKDKDNGSGGGGGEDGGARTAAQTYVAELENALNTALPDVDLGPLKAVTCGDEFTKMEDELAEALDYGESQSADPESQPKIQLRMKDFKETSDGATFTMTQRVVGDDSDNESKDMTVAKEGGDWKVCGLYDEGGGTETNEPPEEPTVEPSEAPNTAIPPNPIPTT